MFHSFLEGLYHIFRIFYLVGSHLLNPLNRGYSLRKREEKNLPLQRGRRAIVAAKCDREDFVLSTNSMT